MYSELIFGKLADAVGPTPYGGTRGASNRGSNFIWMDNFSVHNNADVKSFLESVGVITAFYPPNMTSELQILDLVVNKLLKQAMRRWRDREIADYFTTFKMMLLSNKDKWSRHKLLTEKMNPPKPLLHVRMLQLFEYVESLSDDTSEKNQSFRESVRKSFISTGSYPSDGINFIKYSSEKRADLGKIAAEHQRPEFIDLTEDDVHELIDNAADFIDSPTLEEGDEEGDDDSDDEETAGIGAFLQGAVDHFFG